MNANARVGMMAFVGVVAAAVFAGSADAGSDEMNATDVNPVFAPMRELPRAALDHSNELVAQDEEGAALQALQQLPNNGFVGNNSIAASAFSDSRVFAAVVQNNGSYVNIQNLLAVEVNMH